MSLFINTHTRELLRKVEALSDPDAVAETQLPATTNALTLVYREMVKRRQKEKQNKPNRTDQEVLVLAEAG